MALQNTVIVGIETELENYAHRTFIDDIAVGNAVNGVTDGCYILLKAFDFGNLFVK